MHMMAPMSAGTLRVVCVIKQEPGDPGEGRGQRGNHDERIQPGLKVDYDQQVYKYDRERQTTQKTDVGCSHRLNLPADNDSSHTQFYMPSDIAVDPANGDIYVADGYGNSRIAVFDRSGKFLRQWGHQGTKEEADAGVGGAFMQVVHCVAIGNDGLIYVCDRQADRIQVFDKMGNFKNNIWIKRGDSLPDNWGTTWWIGFSPDREQKYMYVDDGGDEQVKILDRASGEVLASFGRPGHQIGEFTHGHTLAVDSKGNIFVAETDWGRRVQKFEPVK
jgi:DNA-binding beta-propeller fold protein YncE